MLAKAYGRIGKQEQMQALLRQVKQATTHTDEVTSALAEISARQGDIESALEEYADLVRSYRDKRQTDNALRVLREMTRLAPEDPRAHEELADIYIGRGLLEDGIAELRLLVDTYLRQNRMQEASEVLQRLGNIYAETGSADDAFMSFRRAADLTPDNMDLLREVVSFCWQIGRAREATEYQQVIARHYFDTHQVKESVAALQQLIAIDRGNFDAYDMLGQTYQSAAVAPDGRPREPFMRDPELYYHPGSTPGSVVPHAWLEHRKARVSTLDLVGHGRFTLLTGVGGHDWRGIAARVGRQLGIDIDVVSIGGPNCDAHDVYGTWHTHRDTTDAGAVLVRPDRFVCWRQQDCGEGAEQALSEAMLGILGRRAGNAGHLRAA